MNDFLLHNVAMLHGLWLLPLLAILFFYAARRRQQSLRRFADEQLLHKLVGLQPADPSKRLLKALLLLCAVASLVMALARPAWNLVEQETVQRGRDVVFLLDVSRSMLAEDLAPNRLARAKLAILDAVDRLEGDRVALAVFAGSVVVKCPLTLDYGFFRLALEDISPLSVSRGGTLIGDALRKVLSDVFDKKLDGYKDIILITDGEDHESFPLEAAAEVGEQGVRLIAIGLGDDRMGQRIPVLTDTSSNDNRSFLRHEGREVWSMLDAEVLRSMVAMTPGGRYLNVSTGAIDLGEVYRRLIASAEGRELGSRKTERREEKFQVFLFLCLLALALELLLREAKRIRLVSSAASWLILVVSSQGVLSAASVRELVNEGNQAYRSEQYEQALKSYKDAQLQDPESPYVSLNRANALYRQEKFSDAIEWYGKAVHQSLEHGLPEIEANGLHNLGNALYQQAESVAQQDPRQALDNLVQAARSYGDALQIDSSLAASAYNLELARRRIQELREQAQNQPQDGDSDQGQSDQNQDESKGDSLQQAAQKQQELANQSKQLEQDRQEQRDADSRKQQEQQAQDLADKQQEMNKQTESLGENADPQTRQQLDTASEHQKKAQSDLEQNKPGEASEHQQKAADALKQAAERQQQQDQKPQQALGEQQAQPEEDSPRLSEREQEMTVEQILAKEKLDRRRRQQQQRIGVVAVEKDW